MSASGRRAARRHGPPGRALVLGGGGMLGRALVAEARGRGWAALGLSRATADIRDRRRLSRWVEDFRPDAIFNCAAFTRVDDCESQSEEAHSINGEAVGEVAAVAAAADLPLIQLSTDYVFDGEATQPYTEEAPTGPRSVYGASKLAGERQALSWEKALVVRTSWLFGDRGPNFVDTVLRLLAEGRAPLRVVADQHGCPTYVPFLARALCELAALGARGVVHYRNRDPISWHGFAEEISRSWEPTAEVRPITTAEFPRPAPRPTYSVLAVDRFEGLVGRPVEPWRWGLAQHLTARRFAARASKE